MNRWTCTKCGEHAISKCPHQRSVFPDDEMAAIMSYVYGFEVHVGRYGEYDRNASRVTVSLQYQMVVDHDEAEAMHEWDLDYVGTPYVPNCNVPPKPQEPPRYTRVKFRNMNLNMSIERLNAEWKEYTAWYKAAKAEYDIKIVEYEEALLKFRLDMAEYDVKFKEYVQYKEAWPHVQAHNEEARRLRKEFFKKNLDNILKINRESLEHWLCDHDWVLAKDEPGNTCSLGCTHRKEA